MGFVATINVPGYSPMDDDPPVFDTAQDAWAYLRDERERGEDDTEGGDYSDTHHSLDQCSGNLGSARIAWWAHLGTMDGQGTVHGPTPGYDGDHDLGLAYSVNLVEDEITAD